MIFKITLTPQQMQTLAGVLDTAVKALGIRSQEDDFRSLFDALTAAEQVQADKSNEETA